MTDKFYKLTAAEWVVAVKELTSSERDLLFYIKIQNPFTDRDIEINIPETAKLFGCHRTTLNKALNGLVEKGWFSSQVKVVTLKAKKKYLQCVDAGALQKINNAEKSQHNALQKINTHVENSQHSVAKNLTCVAKNLTCVAKNQHTQAESQPQRGIQNLQTLQTSKIKKDSLSDAKKYFDFLETLWPEERESWDKFIQEKISRLPQKPCLLDEWLIALSASGRPRWESLNVEWSNFERQQAYARTNVPVGVDDKANSFIKWLEKLVGPLEVKRNVQTVLNGFIYGNYVDIPLELDSLLDLPLEQIKQQLNWRSV